MYGTFFCKHCILPRKVIYNMGKEKKKNSQGKNKQEMRDANSEKNYKTKYIAIIFTLGGMVLAGLFGKLGEFIFDRSSDILHSPEKITTLQASLDSLESKIDEIADLEIKSQFIGYDREIAHIEDEIKETKGKIESVEKQLESIQENKTNISYMKLLPSQKITLQKKTETSDYQLAEPEWKATDVVAVDPVNNKQYQAKDLSNITLLLPYIENNQEIYFYGQYNDNNHWDENCIINVYENDDLILIMDAIYEDGNLIEYKQVFPYKTGKGKAAWIISDRKVMEEYNSGDSWSYIRTKSLTKTFTKETVVAGNIISVDEFKEIIDEPLEGFYHGNTSNGQYNDDTGNAYQVKYFEDGTVSLIYQGNFKNGYFDDSTGNAWYICKEVNTEYMYYKGKFSKGKPLNDDKSEFINPISLEQIKQLLKGKEFICELKWYENM